jgi:hypothetical protein
MSERPFLKLLKAYLLRAIDALPEENHIALTALEPKLQATYSYRASWDLIVAKEMDFPPDFPDQVRHIWRRNCELAYQAGQKLEPLAFVEMFLKENFPFANE